MMKKLYEHLRDKTNIKNCKLLAPFIFLIYYPMRKKYIFDNIDMYFRKNMSQKRKTNLAKKMIWSKIIYGFQPDEFYSFGLENISLNAMKSFIRNIYHKPLCNKMNDITKVDILNNKLETYKVFGKYFGREVSFITIDDIGKANLLKFTEKHQKFMAKTVNGSLGREIKKVDLDDYASFDDMCNYLFKKYKNGFLAEELIVQSEEMAKFNPSSVNTFRMPTFRFDDRTEIRNPLIRMGRKGSIVDNAGAGGIFAIIDNKTGILYAAVDEMGNNYLVHPDSGVQIIGYKVPHWEEIKSFAIELAQVIPENRHVGWDIAVTDKGCIMVEGNSCPQFGQQIALKKGFRPELEEIMKEMGIKN